MLGGVWLNVIVVLEFVVLVLNCWLEMLVIIWFELFVSVILGILGEVWGSKFWNSNIIS